MTEGTRPAVRPHRGTLVLVFGILGVVMCVPLGIAAWVMGNGDLAAMERGEMDRAGEGSTKAGKVCGIVGVVLAGAAVLIHVLLFSALSVLWVQSR